MDTATPTPIVAAPGGIQCRDYQLQAIDDLTMAAAAGKRRLLLQAACGSGKTVIASKIINHAVSNGKKVLFLAHRREIVNQTVDKLESFGVHAGVIMAGDGWDKSQLVQVASISTLHSWCIRRKNESLPKADLIVCDESHHLSSSGSWKDLVNCYPDSLLLGMTATPCNRRGKGMGHFFDAMIRCPSIRELTEQGYLVPARYYAPSIPDLRGIKVQAGDYVEKQLEERLDKPKLVGDVVENWARICPDRKTMCFASGIKHSKHLVEVFNSIGVKAAHVDGTTPPEERAAAVNGFSSGDIRVLSNCSVFTEGTDIPAASSLIFARPTKSLLLYLQVAGRVLRPFPEKKDCLVLDHGGVVYEHGPIDQDWDWQLDYGDGDIRTKMLGTHKPPKEITCLNCKCVYWKKLCCPECGWKPTVQGKDVQTYPGYLHALDEIEQEKNKVDEKSWYLQMRGYCRSKGKKDGLAFYIFQDKFSRKPPWGWRDLEPIEPGYEVLSYIRSRNIRWAKSRYNPGSGYDQKESLERLENRFGVKPPSPSWLERQ